MFTDMKTIFTQLQEKLDDFKDSQHGQTDPQTNGSAHVWGKLCRLKMNLKKVIFLNHYNLKDFRCEIM